MKNKLLLLTLLIFPFVLQAQNFIPFQGIALDGSGKALASKKIGIKISILKDNASGTISYAESQAPTTDNNGLFQVNIGSGTALTNTFAAIDWSTLNYFLKLEMDVNGGTSYTLISTTQMGFVPFAFYAKNGGSGSTVTGSGVTIDGKGNTAAGGAKFSSITTGLGNYAFSNNSFDKTTTGDRNVAIGNSSMVENSTGGYNTAVGIATLNQNTSGRSNTAIGMNSLRLNSIGYDNSALGFYSLQNNTTGYENTAVGSQSLQNNSTGTSNVGIGSNSLYSNTTGSWNTAVGDQALRNHTIGIANVAIGQGSLYSNTTGSQNVSVGRGSLGSNLTSNNTAVGDRTLNSNTTGNANTAIGSISGIANKSGSNNIFLGYNAQSSTENASNEITFGDSNIKAIRSAVTSITSLSDARDKKNIQDLSLGLNFIQTLKPRSFQWDKREWYPGNTSDGSKLAKTATAGFIAQELDESQQKFNADWLNLVYKSNPEKLEANYGNLTPIIVKAIQELSDANKALMEENKAIKIEIEKLKNK